MKTFGNNKKLKQELIKKLQRHQDLDAFIQGAWSDVDSDKVEDDTFKDCFYGCTMQTEEDLVEKILEKYNIDLWYYYLVKKIFKGLPKGEYEKFPLESIEMLPVGVDINKIKSLFHYRVLEDQLQFCKNDEKVTNSILKCMELFKTPFDLIDESAARAASESARLAAEASWSAVRSAWSAAESARLAVGSVTESAELASWLATRSATSAARSAADSVSRSARSAAKQEYYIFLKDTLFTCIKETY